MSLTEDKSELLKIDQHTEEVILQLCNIILVNEDELDVEEGKKFIEEYINKQIKLSGNKLIVRFRVQTRITQYIEECPDKTQLFAFANDNKYYKFRKSLIDHYYKHYFTTPGQHDEHEIPQQINWVFDCIQEAVDFHTLYEKCSILMLNDIIDETTKSAKEASEKAAIKADLAAADAETAADRAAENAIDKVLKGEQLKTRIQENIDCQMNNVKSKMSETSVTILGIFSGIVLTVVAGLFYSSSVLASVNSANFFRLMSVASLVGLVCIYMIVVMFHFIEKLGKDNSKNDNQNSTQIISQKEDCFFSDKRVATISSILIIIMIVSGILQFIFPTQITDINSDKPNIEVDVNVNGSDHTWNTDDITETSTDSEDTTEALTTEAPEDITHSAENTQ